MGVPRSAIVAEAASDGEPAYDTNTARGVAASRRPKTSILARKERQMDDSEFHRLKRLPPYVFAEVNAMKARARARRPGRDRSRHGQSRPADAAAHRRQAGRGGAPTRAPTAIPPRAAFPACARPRSAYYARRFNVELDPESEIIVDPGLEGRPRQSRPGDHLAGRHRAGAQPELSDPSLRLHHRRRLGAPHSGAGRTLARRSSCRRSSGRCATRCPRRSRWC